MTSERYPEFAVVTDDGVKSMRAYACIPTITAPAPSRDDLARSFARLDDDMTPDDDLAPLLGVIRGESGISAAKAEALVRLYDEGLYPAPEVMTWLAEGFRQWLANDGEKPLEECLGLRQPDKRRASNQVAALRRADRLSNLTGDIHRLRRAFSLSIGEAAGMVAAMIADEPNPYDEGTLIQYYKSAPIWPVFDDILSKMSDATRAKLLARFPPHSYAHLLRKRPILRRIARVSSNGIPPI